MRYEATAYSVERETASCKANPGRQNRCSVASSYSGAYTVQNTERKVGGRYIDLFFTNHAEAKQFGKEPMQVRIVQRGTASKQQITGTRHPKESEFVR